MKFKKNDYINILYSVIAAIIEAFAYSNFINQASLYSSGFSGIASIISNVCANYFNINISFSVLYFGMNILVTGFVFKEIGKKFTIFSVIEFTLMSILLPLFPVFNFSTNPLLLAIFGGIIKGFACGLALSHNASTGGLDFVSIYFANKYNKSVWNYILICNAVIIGVSGILFGWEIALYSIIMQYCSTQVVSSMHKRYTHQTIIIITNKKDEVIQEILKGTRHGITILNGTGAYFRQDVYLLYTVVNSFQTDEVIKACKKADPNVFINIQDSKGVEGNYYRLPLE